MTNQLYVYTLEVQPPFFFLGSWLRVSPCFKVGIYHRPK